ncbi:hypothetical protein IBTHAUMO2_590072 [Nitrosopumilaceae archaeon]|nr:hypothetical protein [Nitrosopumilus sp.]CAI9832131.1 hypothetical protein IBTHAUMO2_590072 [Nitrosopumilaceae archaeon]MDA7945065.1 hypothetical protein [Nitrosopumilus sp.]MDA7954468.1 hypothetical protein [Nitrosopumilus sp.]MDA7973591.1 hypothetical protein [Nitrosopumilus sp.]
MAVPDESEKGSEGLEIDIVRMTSILRDVLKSDTYRDFTLDLVENKIWDFDNHHDALDAFKKHSKNGQAVYFYAVTNGDSGISHEIISTYIKLDKIGLRPYIGRWVDDKGRVFIDVSLAVDEGIGDEKIRDILTMHRQKRAIKLTGIYKKGNIVGVGVDNVDR